MAQGGYKAFEFIYYGTGSTPAYGDVINIINQQILKPCCVGLCQTGGWENDPDFTPTDDDFVRIGDAPTSSSTITRAASCHFLKNQSGARICVAYFYGYANQIFSSELFCNQGSWGTNTTTYYRNKGAGLSFSMIPPGYDQETWDISNSCKNATFLPLHAIPFVSLASMISNTAMSSVNDHAAVGYSYVIITKGNTIIFSCKKKGSNTINRKWCMIGEIFGQLCNEDDNTPSSHYAGALIVPTSSSTGSSSSDFNYEYNSNISQGENTTFYLTQGIFTFFNSNTNSFQTWSANAYQRWFPTNSVAARIDVTTNVSTGQAAYSAIGIYIGSTNPNQHGVVVGNGYKGYVDTDLMRLVAPQIPNGQLFNDGAFIHIGLGVAIGWDASNTVNPFVI